MLRRILLVAVLAGVAGLGIFWWLTIPAVVAATSLPAYQPNLANGATIFNAGGCSSCHAVPNQPDRTRLGGGLAIPSPFGTFYAPNISPDANDGIGRWTEAEFVTAVTKGTAPSGAHYFPAFPYTSYQHAKLEDVRDLFAYLKTLAPVPGKVRDHDVPFPFNIRRNVGVWKWLFMDGKPFVPDAAKSPQWNRGAYLVNSFGHCAECHSPRNFLGGIISSAAICRRAQSGRRRLGPQHHAKGARGVEREGYRLFPRNRPDARWRQRRRIDGARDQEHLAIAGAGSRRDRRLHQVAAAGRGTAAAEEGGERRQILMRQPISGNRSQPASLAIFEPCDLEGEVLTRRMRGSGTNRCRTP